MHSPCYGSYMPTWKSELLQLWTTLVRCICEVTSKVWKWASAVNCSLTDNNIIWLLGFDPLDTSGLCSIVFTQTPENSRAYQTVTDVLAMSKPSLTLSMPADQLPWWPAPSTYSRWSLSQLADEISLARDI